MYDDYTMKNLKSTISKLDKNGENLELLGMISLNSDNEKYNPYFLFLRLDNSIYKLSVCEDLIMFDKLDNPDEIINLINDYNSYKLYIKNEINVTGINKQNPIVNLLKSGESFNEDDSLWTNDFIINKDNYYAVFISENYIEVDFEKFVSRIIENINEVFDDKINDYKRLSMLGYSDKQINQIIKSKSIYDIEPIVNNSFNPEILKEYNNAFKNIIDPKFDNILKLCLLARSNYNFLIDKTFDTKIIDYIISKIKKGIYFPDKITSDYSLEHIKQIYDMIEKQYSQEAIDLIKNPLYSLEQIQSIRQCLEYISPEKLTWITPEYSEQSIIDISNKILNGENIKYYLKENENTMSLDRIITLAQNKIKSMNIDAKEQIR